MKKQKIVFIPYVFVIVICLFLSCAPKENKTQKKSKNIVNTLQIVAKKKKIQNMYQVTGELIAVKEVTLSAEISGRIVQRNVYTGDTVKKTQVLYLIDRGFLDIEQQRLKERILLEQARVLEAKNNLQRQKRLGISTTTQELENAHTRYVIAEKNEAILHQNLREVNLKIAKTTITAPFTGEISKFFFKKDEFVQNSQPVISLIDRSELKVVVGIPEDLLLKIKKSQIVIYVPSINKKYRSEIFCTYPKLNNNTKKIPIEIRIPNKDKKLYSGMFCEIKFYLRQKQVIVVPLSFVKEAYGMYFVKVIDQGIVVSQKVVAKIHQDKWIIQKGIREGQKLQEY